MEKIRINEIPMQEKIYSKKYSELYLYVEQEKIKVFKKFKKDYIIGTLDDGFDIEETILKGTEIVTNKNIIKPEKIVYDNCEFIGYTMPCIIGKDIYNIDRTELIDYLIKLEEIIKESKNIVFPDLLSEGNILINEGNISLLDFDGLQIENYCSPCISSTLGNQNIYMNDKYMNKDLFTKELDKKSLINLYIYLCYGYELEQIDSIERYDKKQKELEKAFRQCRIPEELFEKVMLLYDNNKENEYIGDIIKRTSIQYKITSPFERLVRK